MLVQPLLIGGYLPGLSGRIGRRAHHWIGGALVVAVVIHVGGLWITSPPDMIDALLFASPTPFSPFGVIAMWAIFAVALLAAFRRRSATANVAHRPHAARDCHRRRECGPRHPDRGHDGDGLEGGALRAGPRGDHKSHGWPTGVAKANDVARREHCATVNQAEVKRSANLNIVSEPSLRTKPMPVPALRRSSRRSVSKEKFSNK